MSRTIELLAPAGNLACGIAAIDHGADAVYIGAERFGARAAAGNTLEDIGKLCTYAHKFLARVYVTVNTILYDNETEETLRLIRNLATAGVDAILVQDMAIVELIRERRAELGTLPALHASTQTDNRTPEKVRWLRGLGFNRVVLARELSAAEIAAIHRAVPDVELEVFVHGALCVSYSGVCYASQHCFGRSANRGECAQFCRLQFDLVDADNRVIERGRHLLSLKDMNRYDDIETLLDAGAVSLKIEGRLKNIEYVKNVTAAYSARLDDIVAKSNGKYRRSSIGRSRCAFTPNLHKTFNRGFTDYFLDGRRHDISSFDTPKARGEFVGTVKEIRGGSFNVAGTATFSNGDGLCFINADHRLEGFRVNKVLNNRLFPQKMPVSLRSGMSLWRNSDMDFERQLARSGNCRKIPVDIRMSRNDDAFVLTACVDGAHCASVVFDDDVQKAQKPQRDNIVRQLSKLGNTVYECASVDVEPAAAECFIPSSRLADMRRAMIEKLDDVIAKEASQRADAAEGGKAPMPLYPAGYPYLYNISNSAARRFYRREGLDSDAAAFEQGTSVPHPLVMQCRYCLRHALGFCVKNGGRRPSWHEPLYLQSADGRRFRLQFDCSKCQMNIYAED
ncbi:peptidase U32 family protein [Xylanibacter caecicola]|uniref:peptidase U32 family protein n=1 Tax=Xylanibacter caecicola TaxID=2736294 RepID=UPI002583D0A5|nr:U32 family peptidase [Xylanibacter caecicola]